ncbi:MAG: Flp pilus assembly complex ATPase component TadA [Lachnospiraceae bacterium]|nr:Flp pilus assembly complex ATPase component TadA [Lachnospiraceae bacterium]
MDLGREYFGPLWKYIANEEITDVDYNGKEVWLTNIYNERYKVSQAFVDENLTPAFVEQFTQRIANVVSRQFNKQNPELEAETSELRVTIVHESVARSGRSISIRKTPPVIRLTSKKALEEHYCDQRTLAMLINCVQAKMNMIFCGMPGIGKTECVKFFSRYIPGNERVITIEDTMEIRYGETNPGKDCVEMRVSPIFDYADAIKASLRLNPKWIMLSEARSKEVKFLLESWSTGVCGMTTLHTDDVHNIPDRILNMLETRVDADRLENDIFQATDVGILIRKKKNEQNMTYRYIDQVCFFLREQGQNHTVMAVQDGKLVTRQLPGQILRRMERAGILDPFVCPVLEEELSI